MFSELFFFRSLFPGLYRLVMAAIILLFGFFVVDAAVELALAPDHGQARPTVHDSRRSR